MQEYRSLSIPREANLDNILSPVLNHIRKKSINSIHQLPQNLVFPQQHSDFRKTQRVFCKQIKKQSVDTIVLDNFLDKGRRTVNATPKTSFSKKRCTPAKIDIVNDFRVILINPASKIKSHLVKSIDFNQIEEALYRKPKYYDRFTDLCSKIQTKSKDKNPQNTISSFQTHPQKQQALKLFDLSKNILINRATNIDNDRTIFRKKFWRRGKSQGIMRQVDGSEGNSFRVETKQLSRRQVRKAWTSKCQ